MNIYDYLDYKEILQKRLIEKKKLAGRSISFQKMAEACKVQKTYLSKVFHEDKAHLSQDQLYLANQYLGFSSEESKYLQLLYEHARTNLKERRSALLESITILRKQRLKTESHISAKKTEASATTLQQYYLDPYLQIVHIFLTIKSFRDAPDLIRAKLGLSRTHFASIIDGLQKLGVVANESGKLTVISKSMHLSSDSPLIGPYRSLLRLKAAEQSNKQQHDGKTYNFSVIFSTNVDTRRRIQERFLSFIKDAEKLVGAAEPTDVYQLNFDLLAWS